MALVTQLLSGLNVGTSYVLLDASSESGVADTVRMSSRRSLSAVMRSHGVQLPKSIETRPPTLHTSDLRDCAWMRSPEAPPPDSSNALTSTFCIVTATVG